MPKYVGCTRATSNDRYNPWNWMDLLFKTLYFLPSLLGKMNLMNILFGDWFE